MENMYEGRIPHYRPPSQSQLEAMKKKYLEKIEKDTSTLIELAQRLQAKYQITLDQAYLFLKINAELRISLTSLDTGISGCVVEDIPDYPPENL